MNTEELAQRLMRVHTALLASDLPNHMVDEYRPALEQAAARLRALAEDAERLDWLSRNGATIEKTPGGAYAVVWHDGTEYELTIRTAIDKARHD